MNKTEPKTLTLKHRQQITPNMLRLTLNGPALDAIIQAYGEEYANHYAGAYIKLELTDEGSAYIESADVSQEPRLRTYSIRRFDIQAKEIDIDFVLHGNEPCNGLASYWAQNANIGSKISIRGPGSIKPVETSADAFCLAADMTALPALSTVLEQLHSDATGFAVIQVTSEADQQPLNKPDGIELIWVTSGADHQDKSPLVEVFENQPWPSGVVFAWAACEFSSMRQLRKYLRNEKSVDKDNLYLSSYWKQGRTEDQHKIDKRKDLEQQ